MKHVRGLDALAPLPEDRLLYADVSGLAAGGLIPWTEHRYTRTLQGHKQLRRVEVAAVGDLTSWDGFVEAAAGYGAPDATLWACLIRETDAPPGAPLPRCLVSTRPWTDGFAAPQAYRPRWHIKDDTDRELKEGWGLEEQRWGRDCAAARGHLTLTCLAVTTAQVSRTRAGEQMVRRGIRRLRRVHQPALGAAPAVLYVAGCFAVLALEDLLGPVLPHRRGPPPAPRRRPCLPPLGVDGWADHACIRARDTAQRGSLPRPALLSRTGQGHHGRAALVARSPYSQGLPVLWLALPQRSPSSAISKCLRETVLP